MDLEALLALLLGSLLMVVICGAWYVLQVAANWKIYTKAGRAGWKSLIPIYNAYVLFDICWDTRFYWYALLSGAAAGLLTGISSAVSNGAVTAVLLLLAAALMLVAGLISVAEMYQLAKVFGHGVGFALGLILLNPLFMLILGLGGDKYQGKD